MNRHSFRGAHCPHGTAVTAGSGGASGHGTEGVSASGGDTQPRLGKLQLSCAGSIGSLGS
jgi:hypothetical protein